MRTAAMWALLFLAAVPTQARAQVDACTLASREEIKAALERPELGPAKNGRASGGYSDCTFPGLGAGDVRILLSPPSKDAARDFELKEQVLKEEQKTFEKLSGIGEGAYYYDDRLEFRAGDRIVAVWVNRTPRTEADTTVRVALTTLARRMTLALRTK